MKLEQIPTPAYVVEEERLEENLKILAQVREQAGCKVLLAQKAFSMFAVYPLIARYLDGVTASGLYEARLGHEKMPGRENHVFSPAYRAGEILEIAEYCDHVIFNSFSQLKRYGETVCAVHRQRGLSSGIGLRLNPEHSTQDQGIYDPCAPFSRLGVTREGFEKALDADPGALRGVEGFHFHTLCEQGFAPLEETWQAVEEKFGAHLIRPEIKWVNLGGGHHITRPDYDKEGLIRLIRRIRSRYQVEVYLEPGEAVALRAGLLAATVLDQVENGMTTLILDASAACHMPDVLEMPYRPPLWGAGRAGEKAFTYRLSSCTCLAGDVIGDYSFDRPQNSGDRLYFEDMAIYSMVKNNTFNGMGLPSIWLRHRDGECELVKRFGYEDVKGRLS